MKTLTKQQYEKVWVALLLAGSDPCLCRSDYKILRNGKTVQEGTFPKKCVKHMALEALRAIGALKRREQVDS